MEPGYSKVNCNHCGGHIEFPAQMLNQTINCPHCQSNIVLRADIQTQCVPPGFVSQGLITEASVSPTAKSHFRWKLLCGVGLLVLVLGLCSLLIAVFSKARNQRQATDTARESRTSPQSAKSVLTLPLALRLMRMYSSPVSSIEYSSSPSNKSHRHFPVDQP